MTGGAVSVFGQDGGRPSSSCRSLRVVSPIPRPAPDNVGQVAVPVGPGGELRLLVHGNNGNCSIPSSATAVAMNVTAVGGTATSFLTVWPADARGRSRRA
ncbi:MAG: hypothetical protein R2713_17875 [Ilumatobacteraceae bacterium]